MPPSLPRRALPLSAALITLIGTAAPATAGLPHGPPGTVAVAAPEPPPPTETVRYGLQVLLADVALVATISALDESTDDDGVASVAALGFYATGPLVHLAHGNRAGAVNSLAARALLPGAGALLGYVATADGDCGGDEFCLDGLGGAFAGAMVGTVTALLLDYTVFSKVEKPIAPSTTSLARARIAPVVKISGQAFTVGAGGSF